MVTESTLLIITLGPPCSIVDSSDIIPAQAGLGGIMGGRRDRSMEAFIDPGFDVFFRVAFGKFVEPEEVSPFRGNRRILSVPLDPIPHILKVLIEVIERLRKLNGPVYVGVHDIVDGRMRRVFPMVLFRVGTCPPFHRFLYHGEMVLFAERIRQLADAVVILRIRLMVFMTVYAGDRIYYQVVVDMGFIHMGGNHNFKIVTKKFLGKLYSNFMGLLRCDLTGCERLLHVISLSAIPFSEALLCHYHVLTNLLRCIYQQVDSADQFSIFRFLRGHNIADYIVEPFFYRPYFSGRHFSPVPEPPFLFL